MRLLSLAPGLVLLVTIVAVYPARPTVAPLRLAMLRAALATCGFAVLSIETLSTVHAVGYPWLPAAWGAALVGVTAIASARHGRRLLRAPRWLAARLGGQWSAMAPPERVVAAILVLLTALELTVALVAPPNNWDSQVYHLPRVAHWAQQRSVDLYPTTIHRQVDLGPGAEYLLLTMRVLGDGGDAFLNLVQWAALLGCVLVASRVAAQLGAGTRGQLLAALVAGTAPAAVLEATSTQNDLVAALWAVAVATLALDGLRARISAVDALALGTATGLAALTKASGLVMIAPLLVIWAGGTLLGAGRADGRRARDVLRLAAACGAVMALTAALAGPFMLRIDREFGSPLGPPYLVQSIGMVRHDPAAVLVNGLRAMHTATVLPIVPIEARLADGVDAVTRAVGVDPGDPRLAFVGTAFPFVPMNADEDTASYPVQALLVLLGTGFCLLGRRRAAAVRVYALACVLAYVAFAATVRWQPWVNRLALPGLMLAAPLAGVWLTGAGRGLASVLRTAPRRSEVAALATSLVVVLAGYTALDAQLHSTERPVLGPRSVFALTGPQLRFVWRPYLQRPYQQAATAVADSGAHRVGLLETTDAWEYPWWVMLPDRQIVSVSSGLPRQTAPPLRSVQAVICTLPAAACLGAAPAGWTIRTFPDVVVLLAPQ